MRWRSSSSGQAKVLPLASMVRVGSATTVARREWGMFLDFRKSSALAAFSGVIVMTMRDCDSLKRAISARVHPRDKRVPPLA
jgi:hypothetical protein